MKNQDLEQRFQKHLSLHYGNRKSLHNALLKSLSKYSSAKNPHLPSVKHRINLINQLIERVQQLRSVKVTYSDNTEITTSMSCYLSDSEIFNYFKEGKLFNIGVVHDNMQSVIKCEIIK